MKAKKKPNPGLDLEAMKKALQGIQDERKLDESIVENALIEALIKAYRKDCCNPEAYVRVEIEDGRIHIYKQFMIVDEPENEDDLDDQMEITLREAKKIRPDAKIGEFIDQEVNFADFDRASVVLAKNVMKQKIREAEKQQVYEEYCDKVDEMVPGTIEAVDEKSVIVNIGKTLAMMRKSDQIPTEKYVEGQRLPVVITTVNKESKGAQVLVSRSTPVFVKRLFEREVPEIYNGIIEIKNIARDPGERCKIAVYSHNENIDPIGACIGPRGARVQTIIHELGGEKIDIFEWSDDLQKLIKNALAPSEAIAVFPNPEEKDGLIVVVPDSQLSLAIGKKGKNARLAVKLSGRKIDIKSKSQIEEMGIDYMGLSQAMHDEYEEMKARERAYKQQQRIEEIRSAEEDIQDIADVGFDYEEEPESNDLMPHTTQTLYEVEQEEARNGQKSQPEEEEEKLDEMEEAARIAHEKRKEKSISDVSTYTSRFEEFAGSHKSEPVQPARKKEEPKKEETPKAEKKKPAFGEIKPIYTEEELAEIEEQEEEDEYGTWDDDIDYEEFDSFYDD